MPICMLFTFLFSSCLDKFQSSIETVMREGLGGSFSVI